MLTDEDIEYMKASSDEIKTKRKRLIEVIYETSSKNPITGEPEGVQEVIREVESVITEVSAYGSAERYLSNGIEYEKGDLQISVQIELIEDIAELIEQITHDGKRYVIIAMDKKGIGKRNRYEMIARLIA